MLQFARQLLPLKKTDKLSDRYRLWVDGVGCFWLFMGERISIGGPEPISSKNDGRDEAADLALLSDLKRHHAAILRTGEGYLLEAQGPAKASGREVLQRATLSDRATIELGRSVAMRLRQPSALSLSARLDFLSDHRPSQTVDGVVLLADTCLLGPSDENHIVCPDWSDTVLLVRQGEELWCRSRLPLTLNGHRLGSGRRLQSGDVVVGEDLRFRIEKRH